MSKNLEQMSKSKKIMVVDDNPGILDAIGIMLEFEGYQVQGELNGDMLLTMENEFPDLLLLDIWMSGTDGRDICKHLKQKQNTRNIPIVLVSASKDIEHSAMEAGADDFLAKPFEMDDLLEKIKKYVC
jgi:CheY-like chemotaxis protein